MAWIIVSANGEEIERRELRAGSPVVIGRSSECDLAVRDLLLSRTHCRLEPVGAHAWKIIDLGSKNGTRVGWQRVQTHALRDGDHLRMGRTRLEYRTGPFEQGDRRPGRKDRLVRPADPHEALSGTVTDFVLIDDESGQGSEDDAFFADRPYPQPRPFEPLPDPVAEELLEALAEARWSNGGPSGSGGGVATAERTKSRTVARAQARPPARPVYREVRTSARRAVDMDFSLQADARHLPALAEAQAAPAPMTLRRRVMAVLGFTLIAAAGTGVVVVSLWLLTLAPN
jgi:pSer/pThr/pTyr-binding forkhead associated (FHA) protein